MPKRKQAEADEATLDRIWWPAANQAHDACHEHTPKSARCAIDRSNPYRTPLMAARRRKTGCRAAGSGKPPRAFCRGIKIAKRFRLFDTSGVR